MSCAGGPKHKRFPLSPFSWKHQFTKSSMWIFIRPLCKHGASQLPRKPSPWRTRKGSRMLQGSYSENPRKISSPASLPCCCQSRCSYSRWCVMENCCLRAPNHPRAKMNLGKALLFLAFFPSFHKDLPPLVAGSCQRHLNPPHSSRKQNKTYPSQQVVWSSAGETFPGRAPRQMSKCLNHAFKPGGTSRQE